MKKVNVSALGILFIALLTIAEIHQSGILRMWYLTAVLISVLMWGFAFFYRIGAPGYPYTGKSYYTWPAVIIASQWIVIFAYNILLYLAGIGEPKFAKSSLIQMTLPMLILMGGWGFFYVFKQKAFSYLTFSLVLNFIVILIYQLFRMGIVDFFKGITSVFSGLSIGNPLETNSDAVFALGLFFLFLCNQKYIGPRPCKYTKPLLLLVFIFFCGKRSQYAALLLLALFSFVTGFIPRKNMPGLENLVSVIIIAVYYLYIYLMGSGFLLNFLYDHGVNGMGRFQMWDYVSRFYDFTPAFLGHGFSFSTLMLEHNEIWAYQGAVYSLHGGIIGFYNDLGFLMMGCWMCFNLITVTTIFRKKYGHDIANLYWQLTAYLFVLYLTESSINHFITQTVYIVILLHAVSIKAQGRQCVLPCTEKNAGLTAIRKGPAYGGKYAYGKS